MRRRRAQGRALDAEGVAALFERLVAGNHSASLEVRNHAIHEGLAEHGYDVVHALRARYWLRHGRPAGYAWDEANIPKRGALEELIISDSDS